MNARLHLSGCFVKIWTKFRRVWKEWACKFSQKTTSWSAKMKMGCEIATFTFACVYFSLAIIKNDSSANTCKTKEMAFKLQRTNPRIWRNTSKFLTHTTIRHAFPFCANFVVHLQTNDFSRSNQPTFWTATTEPTFISIYIAPFRNFFHSVAPIFRIEARWTSLVAAGWWNYF